MKMTGTMKQLLGAASLLGVAACMTMPATADDNRYRSVSNVPSHWSDGVANHQRNAYDRPIRVWLEIETSGKPGKGRGWGRGGKYGKPVKAGKSMIREQAFEEMVLADLERRLPRGVILVDSPRRADLRLSVRERDYDFSMRTINVEYRNKPYKNHARSRRPHGPRPSRAWFLYGLLRYSTLIVRMEKS